MRNVRRMFDRRKAVQSRALRQRLFLQTGAMARTAGIVETGDGDIDR